MDAELKRHIDESLEPYRRRAEQNGRTLEEELDVLSTQGRPFTPEERGAVSAFALSKFKEPLPAMTLDEIREGLM